MAGNDEERARFARIDKILEEYRIKHEDLRRFMRGVRERAREMRERSRQVITDAHGRLKNNKSGK